MKARQRTVSFRTNRFSGKLEPLSPQHAPSGRSVRLEWTPRAYHAYKASLAGICEEDPRAADLVRERVERTLALIADYPELGTPGLERGDRVVPIAKTGHVLHYRIHRGLIRIRLWYRARQNVSR